jgi:choline dehydrogenase-like flavoprotein
MQHYYQQAEKLFHVNQVQIRSQVNADLIQHLNEQGMQTYPLYMGKKQTDISCEGCQGLVCTCGKKVDAYNSCLEQAIHQFKACLVTECEVLKLNSNATQVTSALCRWKTESGVQELTISASHFVLAAGALFTPALLLKSKNQFFPNGLSNSSGLVGKNLMRHLIDIYGLWTKNSPESNMDLKEFGAKHFYFDSADQRTKGVLQSFGRLPAVPVLLHEMLEKIQNPILKVLFHMVKPLLGWVLQYVRQRLLFVATILEDSPSETNQIVVNDQGKIQLKYIVSEKDKVLLHSFRKNIQKYIGKFFQLKLMQAHENERIAHACGTCRMGRNKLQSVVNPEGQSHDLKNLWIVDASVFPSSGSVNPSLTIAANALRSAELALKAESQDEASQIKKSVPHLNIL